MGGHQYTNFFTYNPAMRRVIDGQELPLKMLLPTIRNTSFLLAVLLACNACDSPPAIPAQLKSYIETINYGRLGGMQPAVVYDVLSDTLVRVGLTWTLTDTVRQDDWRTEIHPKFTPDFFWAPHLAPTDDYIIAQHLFRAPALIASSMDQQLTVMPDLDLLGGGSPVDWYMDLNAPANTMTLGLSNSEVAEHVLFKRKAGGVYPPGEVNFAFYIMTGNEADHANPWRDILAFQWRKWGAPLYRQDNYLVRDLEPFVKHTYNWAFNTWKQHIWQECTRQANEVGCPVFIVNVPHSPNYPGEVNEREFRSIWTQAAFNSLRSAQGVFRYAQRTRDRQLT